jgi:hypothetical protein
MFFVLQFVRFYGTMLPVMFVVVLMMAIAGQITAFAKGEKRLFVYFISCCMKK